MTGTRVSALHLVGLMTLGLPAVAQAEECRGKIPDYVRPGNQIMPQTDEAERILCRDASALEAWSPKQDELAKAAVVVDKVVDSATLREAALTADRLEFRGCVFPAEIYLEGPIKAELGFVQCEFQGNVDVHNASLSGLHINDSILHHGIHLANTHLTGPLVVRGSVLTGSTELDDTTLDAGLRVHGSRFGGAFVANGLRVALGGIFEESCFLGGVRASAIDINGPLWFRDVQFERGSLLSFGGGTITEGLRFDACMYDGRWHASNGDMASAVIRLSDLSVGGPVYLASTASRERPRLQMSRCIVPFLRLPDWRLARGMITSSAIEGMQLRELEEYGELLQLVSSSYRAQGRLRDARAVRREYRLFLAQMEGGVGGFLLRSRSYFGSGLWWFAGVISIFACILLIRGHAWGVLKRNEPWWTHIYRSCDLSLKAFFSGPPEQKGEHGLERPAVRILAVERVIGLIFLFYLGFVLNEWMQG